MLQKKTTAEKYSVSQIYQAAKIVAYKFKGTINNERAWKATTQAAVNSSLSCFNNPADSCCGISDAPISVFSQNGTPLFELSTGYPPTEAGLNNAQANNAKFNGFTMEGEVCDSFDVKGNDDCPFRIKTYWDSINPTPVIDPNCKLPSQN